MSYQAPLDEILFTLRHVAGLDVLEADGLAPELEGGMAEAVLNEAGRFAAERLAPLNEVGDRQGSVLREGRVVTPPGWQDAYRQWSEAGWNGLVADPDHGGQGLPLLIQAACTEMWNSANFAFALGPLLTAGAIEALQAHGSDHLKRIVLPKIVSGEWMGTMNLTEPQAGSDLAALRTRAERAGDGTYRITGQKIFITYGDHDLTENIVHLVLARLPDAPPGTRGISLFLVPKRLINEDRSLGELNDLRCAGLEHKIGIHASPTCSMVYGEKGGAFGWLVGEENRGLACMFTMMNNARLNVGLQGVAIAERATQRALAFARERRQGRAPGWSGEGMSPIVEHPDVQRMLLTMMAQTRAARSICYITAKALDRSHRDHDPIRRQAAADRAALLTPVAKAYSTDIGIEVSSLGIQIHGGMGYVEETGAAQHWRDARIAAIYEGTNGIQAIDLVTRKLPLANGEAVADAIARMRTTVGRVAGSNAPGLGHAAARLGEAVAALERTTAYLRQALASRPTDALAGATPYLKLFGLALGGTSLAAEALAALGGDDTPATRQRIAVARFFAEHLATEAPSLERTVVEGAQAVEAAASVFAA
jgi:alkylation response protein AidB-like acyl-CoA dehydrogenase